MFDLRIYMVARDIAVVALLRSCLRTRLAVAFAVRLLRGVVRLFRSGMSLIGVAVRHLVVILAVVVGGHAVGLSRLFVMFSCLLVCIAGHTKLLC